MNPEAFLAAYHAARQHAGIIERPEIARIVVSGRDRAAYLHGLLTNDITGLKPGEGCYAAYLTPQGRMITDLWVYELGDLILIELDLAQKAVLLEKLDQFIFSEDVQLGDVTSEFCGFAVVGPAAAMVVGTTLEDAPASELMTLAEHGNRRARFAGQPAIVLRVTHTGEPGYEILTETPQHDALRSALRAAGAIDLDTAVADTLRIEAGLPRFNRDMDDQTIPLEADLESRAISMTKGCYVGQEVIIRVLHRGHGRVVRKLVGLVLDGDAGGHAPGENVPADGSRVEGNGCEIGRTTSGTMSPALSRPIALATLHRDFIAPGTRVLVNGVPAVVTTVPFVEPRV